MEKFIKNVFLFTTVFLVVAFVIEYLLLYQTNIYSYKRKYLEDHFDDIKIIILGNSHIDQGLNPQYISDSTFNLAIQGRDKVYDAELAKKYFPKMRNLKVAIMPIDYFEFCFGREKEDSNVENSLTNSRMLSTYKCMYYKYMGLHVDGWWYWSEIINSKLDYMNRFLMSDEDTRECDSLGYIKREVDKRRDNWKNLSLPNVVDTSKEIDKEMRSQLFLQYETIAQIARNQGLRLILISTPVYRTYQERMNISVYNEMHLYAKYLMQRFPFIEYYDFTYNDNFCEEDFYDSSHLCDSGAKKLSKMVSAIIGKR